MDEGQRNQKYLRLRHEFMGGLYAHTHRLPLSRLKVLILTVITTVFVAALPQYALANDADETWWSLRLPANPQRPQLQNVPAGWNVNPIDAFILRKLRDADLAPSVAADRVTLIRRVSLDLIGLPATPEQVEAFVNDPADIETAYGRVVDRLLASPHYGERWAQHWLDVIRWAETVGFETNIERKNAWHYRDWVIDAFNDDKPYDRFIFEQLAGDTVGEDAALGFLVAGPANLPGQIGRDEAAMRSARQDELDEVIRTVGQSFFGLTFGCARCHDHKFDPIAIEDYYGMQAIFAGINYGARRLRGPLNDEWTARVPDTQNNLTSLRSDLNTLRQQLKLRPPLRTIHTDTFEPIRARAIRMSINAVGGSKAASLYEFEAWTGGATPVNVALATNGARPSASSYALANQTRHFDNLVDGSVDKRQAFPWVSAEVGPAWIRVDFQQPAILDRVVWHAGLGTPADYVIEVLPPDSDEWRAVESSADRQPRIDDARPPKNIQLVGVSPAQTGQLMTLIAQVRLKERALSKWQAGPQTYAARFNSNPEPTWVLDRGDSMRRADQVSSSVPSAIGNLGLTSNTPEAERRLALARDLTRPDHPLTARVMVNRIWQHHFGTGIVETSSDFGKMGAMPSHPELLDWLAQAFIERGWSIKQLHRLIITSQTYRQASAPRANALGIDADSRLLWRFPPRRLEAEAIRDAILTVSGKLNTQMGGAGFDFFNQRGGLADYQAKETFDSTGWRRMIYAHKIRMQDVDIFGAFDCPDAGQMKPNRTRSITPIQALSLLNSPFVNRQAEYFAERVKREVGGEINAQLDHVFGLIYSRLPSVNERGELAELVNDHGLAQLCRVLFNTSEFIYLR